MRSSDVWGKQTNIKPTCFIVCLFAAVSDQDFRNQHLQYSCNHKIRQKKRLAVNTGIFLEGQSQLLCLAVSNYDRKRLPDDYELLIQKFALEGRKLSGMVRVCSWEKTPIQSEFQVHIKCLK